MVREDYNMKNWVRQHRIDLLFCVITLLQLGLLLYYGNEKAYFFGDEIYTYGLSNSVGTPFLTPDSDVWRTSQDYKDYVMVGSDERFRYDSVFANQAADVHPPLYYCFIHMGCSFFPDTFSKWYGIIPSMVFFVLTNCLLFYVSKRLFGNTLKSALPVFIWGFSALGISMGLLIRMYMMQIFCIVLYTVVLFRLFMDKRKRDYFYVAVTVCLGFLTHYHFVIYAFLISAVFSLWLLYRKQFRDFLLFALSAGGGIAAGVLVFPAVFSHIESTTHGREAAKNATNLQHLMESWKEYYKIVNQYLFGGQLKWIVLVLAALLLLMLLCSLLAKVKHKRRPEKAFYFQDVLKRHALSKNLRFLIAVTGVCIAYCLVVINLSLYRDARYIAGVIPLLLLAFSAASVSVLQYFVKHPNGVVVGIALYFAVLSYTAYRDHSLLYVYQDDEQLTAMEAYKGATGVIVFTSPNAAQQYNLCIRPLPCYMMLKETYQVDERELEKLGSALEGKKDEQILVYVRKDAKDPNIMQKVLQNAGFHGYRIIPELSRGYTACNVYLLTNEVS